MGKTLPGNWKVVRIGDISRLIRGVTYVKQDAINNPKEGFVPILRANNIDAELNYDELIYIPSNKVKGEQHIKTDDILIAMSSGSKNLVGKAAQSRIAFDGGFGAFCGLVRVNKNINRKLIGFFFQSSYYRKEVERLSIGANINNLRREHIETIKIPLPPLPTQHKIVEILEEADSLRKLRKQADEKMKDLTPSLFVEMFGDPTTNPKRWGVKKLGEIAEIKSGGTPSRKREEYFKGAIPWVTSVSLSKPYLTADDAKELITQDAIENSATKLIGRKSVLFGNRVCVGNVAINLCNICFSQDVLAILYHEDFLVPEFLWFYLLQKKVYFERITRGSTIKGITVSTLQNTVIPLPPLPLQQEFAERVKEIEAEKQRQAESKKKLDELFNSLMQRAFTGELVA